MQVMPFEQVLQYDITLHEVRDFYMYKLVIKQICVLAFLMTILVFLCVCIFVFLYILIFTLFSFHNSTCFKMFVSLKSPNNSVHLFPIVFKDSQEIQYCVKRHTGQNNFQWEKVKQKLTDMEKVKIFCVWKFAFGKLLEIGKISCIKTKIDSVTYI